MKRYSYWNKNKLYYDVNNNQFYDIDEAHKIAVEKYGYSDEVESPLIYLWDKMTDYNQSQIITLINCLLTENAELTEQCKSLEAECINLIIENKTLKSEIERMVNNEK